MLFRLFENLVDPLKDEKPSRPPEKLWAFIWHYAKPFRWLFLLTIITSILIAFVGLLGTRSLVATPPMAVLRGLT